MKLFLVYAGQRGAGLETTLSIYELLKKLNVEAYLFLSKDNLRREFIQKAYPESKFFNFFSPFDLIKMKKEINENWAFFTMISPKMLPLFVLLKKKIFYFHASYNHSFSKPFISNLIFDFLHDFVIKNSTIILTTHPLLIWQIRSRLDRKAEFLPHPPFILRKNFFVKEKPIKLPFKKYFLYFGELNRKGKGIDLLLEALDFCPRVNIIFAGRGPALPKRKNILHLNDWLDDGTLYYLISNSKAVVLPYLEPAQFSACIAYAIHFRKPVIVPNIPTFEYWVEENKTGWFFSAGDVLSLSKKLVYVWDGKGVYDPKSIKNKEKERERVSKEKMTSFLNSLDRMF
ncbi:MAG: glycosyltransferase [Candidatus Nanoarchaeia archaeon]